MSGTPSVDGTAAQIDRLRRNIRQSTQPSARPSAVQNTRRASQQPSRQASVQEDRIVTDSAYFDDDAYQQPARPQLRSSRARTGTLQSQRRPATQDTFDETYDSDLYTSDLYVDDEGFEDDFSEYDAPRRPERRARPKPQFTMPTISRPSLPPAIARADLVNDAPALGIIGASLASLAGMAIVVANRAESLAPEFATHVSASGILENFKDDSALWNVPLMAAMFTLMNIVMAWFISPLDRFASRFVLVGALVAQFVAWVAIIRIL
ncbi:MAG: hypothetical protein M3457_18715 [Chloroflexota bacterium]|nr:hypothetical protein [Chloroflexota bacterium]